MEYLFQGIKEFQENDFQTHKALFSQLGRKQNPHSLFIGCSDSRIVPNLITNSLPGDMFVIRNIANIVPFYRQTEEYLATLSAIEYAVNVLEVKNIIVCGHSNCGGCNALYMNDKQLSNIPNTRKWLELARPVVKQVEARLGPNPSPEKREWMTEQLNVVEQMNHLLSYPFIADKFEKGEISIIGLYYIIETGEIYKYDELIYQFIKLE